MLRPQWSGAGLFAVSGGSGNSVAEAETSPDDDGVSDWSSAAATPANEPMLSASTRPASSDPNAKRRRGR